MDGPDPRDDRDSRQEPWIQAAWFRQYSLVIQFLVALGLFGYLGHRLDQRYGWQSWGLLGGLILGGAIGLYPLLREGLRQGRDDRQ